MKLYDHEWGCGEGRVSLLTTVRRKREEVETGLIVEEERMEGGIRMVRSNEGQE